MIINYENFIFEKLGVNDDASNSKLKILYNIMLQILFNKQNSSIDLNSIMKKTH